MYQLILCWPKVWVFLPLIDMSINANKNSTSEPSLKWQNFSVETCNFHSYLLGLVKYYLITSLLRIQ